MNIKIDRVLTSFLQTYYEHILLTSCRDIDVEFVILQLVGSCPSYPHGTIDPIVEIAKVFIFKTIILLYVLLSKSWAAMFFNIALEVLHFEIYIGR